MNTAPFLGVVGGAAFSPTKSLQDVVPSVRPQFEALISYATSLGLKPKVRSAGRTCEEQQEQLAGGYSNASLCRSMHTLGHAVDLDVTPGDCATYTKLGTWWEARGGVWGGRWTQFGPCGDAGHFHYGFNGAGAVPTSVCPADVTLAQCKQLRKDYLTQAFSSGGGVSSNMGLLAGLAIVGAAGLILWGTLRVKPGALALKANPTPRDWLYHGSVGDPLDLLLHGIERRADRDGISFTTTVSRAKFWTGLKTRDSVLVLRAPIRALGRLIPENASPAEPDKDFTSTQLAISPAVLEIREGDRWRKLIDVYGDLLDDEELAEWQVKWGTLKVKPGSRSNPETVPMAIAKKGDLVAIWYRGQPATGVVFRVKKDGTKSVRLVDDDEDPVWFDYPPGWVFEAKDY